MHQHETGGLLVRGGDTVIYNVNDNHGRGFTFKQGRNGDGFGWLEVVARLRSLARPELRSNAKSRSAPRSRPTS